MSAATTAPRPHSPLSTLRCCVGLLVDWERKKRASGERVGDDKARKALPHFIQSSKECKYTHSVQFSYVSEASLEHMEQSLACNSYERNLFFKRLVQRTHAHQKVASLLVHTNIKGSALVFFSQLSELTNTQVKCFKMWHWVWEGDYKRERGIDSRLHAWFVYLAILYP